jgi:hypothetical protein
MSITTSKKIANGLKTSDEAVSQLGLDRLGLRDPRESLRWLCRTGRLRFTRIGRRVMFRQEWLDELIDQNTVLRKAPRRESTRGSN